ncbi:hypothetical protein [Sessilibacter sp. MAH4]
MVTPYNYLRLNKTTNKELVSRYTHKHRVYLYQHRSRLGTKWSAADEGQLRSSDNIGLLNAMFFPPLKCCDKLT